MSLIVQLGVTAKGADIAFNIKKNKATNTP